ncbi:MAG TPA: hypothetical protein P5514_11055 [Bacteroidales bacterium]|nr:hypothetical protein [Bacteroidales bacterium]HPE56137.1 hypothetical protein [Bacteroidales bacterium]HRX97475.1 hypothetical protein [Bacteroidales bacterium]
MKAILTSIILTVLLAGSVFSQTKYYTTSGGEMIFSFASIDDNGRSESAVLRWSPWFNLQSMFNADFNEHVGMFVGFSIKNIGFIYDQYRVYSDPEDLGSYTTVKKKFRSYNAGIPVGFKIGKLDKLFVYGGYEVELPFNYKEKTFVGDKKEEKFNVWFSKRQEQFQHGFLLGIQFPYGANLKFKYYLSNFHNMDYVDGNGLKPYAGLKSNVFYISFNADLFKPDNKNSDKGKYY